ncbi:hypothetical protein [Luteolibacter luteus]|uniref:Condensation domain-containing protein n=1 Tax=Luteolibacter luteus TaxID=2728835 RepID=A0A858RJA3_9BACT|nr:hypothetical protein [Luteolibacter luteus]QJE97336.1 hypothetical protein HHL09_16585 [Luteolibacter luteus]
MPASPTSPALHTTCSDGFLLGLESLMRRTSQGRHLAATVLELEGTPDLERIRRVAEKLGKNHPILHARNERSKKDWIARWRTDLASREAVPVKLWHLPGAATAGEGIPSLDELIGQVINGTDIDIHASGPNLIFHVLPLSTARWALVLAWSHSLMDAVGMTKLLQLLAAEANLSAESPPAATHASPVSELYKQAYPMIEEMRKFPKWRPRSLHRKGARPGKSRFHVTTFDRAETAAIRAKMAATAGELLLLPYFASCAARAVQAVISARFPDEEASILLTLPVQRQSDPAKRPLFSNHMTPYTVLLTADDLAELKPATSALYRKYADFMRRKLPVAMHALMRMMERCPSRFYNLPAFIYMRGEICSLFHSHTGAFLPGVDSMFGCRIANGYHVPSVSAPPGIGIFFSEHEGQLALTLSWKDGCLSPLELELLKETLSEDLGAPLP